ncbi:molecular chaperone DnaK [Undibacterium sp. KW1]|uniref:Hsp70 family protein n=1 Tax=Undibacterium sp. KW1 TaxID=2058624 RepID=UPI001331EA8E|nr:Hsp70 family protein [Undibacterium sp. KW1]BBB59388.1 molecular chaperone DnaK [Undibacterium sp. KW1]
MRHALLIGCSQYDDPEIGSLNFASEDAEIFSNLLKTYCGFENEDIEILSSPSEKSPSATRSNIIKKLSIPPNQKNLDLLIIYFSGHGIHSATDGKDYLLPQDAVYRSVEYTAISFDYLLHEVKKWSARCTILVIDACRNVFRNGKAIDTYQSSFNPSEIKLPGVAAFFSCAPSERSYELPNLKSGVFTHAFSEALGDTGKCKTIRELDQYLLHRVPSIGNEYGHPKQTPYTRVDPLSIADTVIVSDQRKLSIAASMKIGKEIRISGKRSESYDEILSDSVLAIDFGTSNSLAIYWNKSGELKYVIGSEGRKNHPSIISFYPNLDYVVGQDLTNEPGNNGKCIAVKNFKRLLTSNDTVNVHGYEISPTVLASLLIASIHKNFEEATGQTGGTVIASVPANFGIAATNKLANAFHMAGVPLTRMIGEPCVAALNIVQLKDFFPSIKKNDGYYAKNILIIDVGGGTTDVSLVEVSYLYPEGDYHFEVQAAYGDNYLGGMDYDEAILSLIERIGRAELANAGASQVQLKRNALMLEAERAKIALGRRSVAHVLLANIETTSGIDNIELEISQAQFLEISEDLNQRLKNCVNKAFSHFPNSPPDFILLAGQGCKILPIIKTIEKLAGNIPLIKDYQENAVITGLAIQAKILSGIGTNVLLLDAIYSGLCVACASTQSIPSESKSSQDLEATISTDVNENTETITLINTFAFIPIYASIRVRITGPLDTPIPLDIYEMSGNNSQQKIGHFLIPPRVVSNLLEIRCDIDANGVTLLKVEEIPDSSNYTEVRLLAKYIVNRYWTQASQSALNAGYKYLSI